MASKNLLTYGLIALAIYLVYTSGALSGFLGGDDGGLDIDLPPSDKKCTVTLNTKNAMVEPALNANISYYVFTGDGSFYKEGSTTAGTTSFDVDSGTSATTRSWTVIMYKDTDSGSDYYPETVDFTTGTESMKTINVLLYQEGEADITAVLDPIDNDNNVTTAQGSVEEFAIFWKSNSTDMAYLNPIFVLEVNDTHVDDVRCPDLNELTCPNRIIDQTGSADFEYYCYQKPGIFTSEMSSSTTAVTCLIEFSSSVSAPVTISNLTVTMQDESMYKEDAYVTLGKAAFKIGSYDPADNSNIGATTTATGEGIWFSG